MGLLQQLGILRIVGLVQVDELLDEDPVFRLLLAQSRVVRSRQVGFFRGEMGERVLAQAAEQPSALEVLPSSQLSPDSTAPLPHTGGVIATVQGCPNVEHEKPASTVQFAEQPSPLTLFPSSQASLGPATPSPQIRVLTQTCPGVGQA